MVLELTGAVETSNPITTRHNRQLPRRRRTIHSLGNRHVRAGQHLALRRRRLEYEAQRGRDGSGAGRRGWDMDEHGVGHGVYKTRVEVPDVNTRLADGGRPTWIYDRTRNRNETCTSDIPRPARLACCRFQPVSLLEGVHVNGPVTLHCTPTGKASYQTPTPTYFFSAHQAATPVSFNSLFTSTRPLRARLQRQAVTWRVSRLVSLTYRAHCRRSEA